MKWQSCVACLFWVAAIGVWVQFHLGGGGGALRSLARIWTTPQEDNSPPYRFRSWWVVLFRGSGPSGELSWWGIVLGIVVLVGNGWALFLSGGELSSWGVVLEPSCQIFSQALARNQVVLPECYLFARIWPLEKKSGVLQHPPPPRLVHPW